MRDLIRFYVLESEAYKKKYWKTKFGRLGLDSAPELFTGIKSNKTS